MGAKVQEPLPPIVLLVGCEEYDVEPLKTIEVQEAYGHELKFIRLPVEDSWWARPTTQANMHRMTDVFTRRSQYTLCRWIETEKFITEVRDLLEGRILVDYSDMLTENWRECVNLICLDERLEPRFSPYTRRVFDGWFPKAVFREYRLQGALQPIWREADVVPIGDARVLDWPISQLHGVYLAAADLKRIEDWLAPDRRVSALVRLEHKAMTGRFEQEVVDGVAETLGSYGLKLGMTEAQLDAVRLGINEPGTLAEIGRISRRRPPDEGADLASIS